MRRMRRRRRGRRGRRGRRVRRAGWRLSSSPPPQPDQPSSRKSKWNHLSPLNNLLVFQESRKLSKLQLGSVPFSPPVRG